MHVSRYVSGVRGQCIKHKEKWYTPQEFEIQAGGSGKKYLDVIQTDYGPLKTLTASGTLKPMSRKYRREEESSPKSTPEKNKKHRKGEDKQEEEPEEEEEEEDGEEEDDEEEDDDDDEEEEDEEAEQEEEAQDEEEEQEEEQVEEEEEEETEQPQETEETTIMIQTQTQTQSTETEIRGSAKRKKKKHRHQQQQQQLLLQEEWRKNILLKSETIETADNSANSLHAQISNGGSEHHHQAPLMDRIEIPASTFGGIVSLSAPTLTTTLLDQPPKISPSAIHLNEQHQQQPQVLYMMSPHPHMTPQHTPAAFASPAMSPAPPGLHLSTTHGQLQLPTVVTSTAQMKNHGKGIDLF